MQRMLPLFIFSLFVHVSFSVAVNAGESHYEVYYFHASWRCTNCTNAEAWAREVVTALNSVNPEANIVYAPKQLETNRQLVSLTKAKRVDLVIAEVRNGKILRHENLGNLLPMVGSKQTLQQHIIDGVIEFSKKSKEAGKLTTPEIATQSAQTTSSNRKMAVYIVQRDSGDGKPREAALVSDVFAQKYPQIIQNNRVSVRLLNPGEKEHTVWLNFFKAKPGDVVVAVIDGTALETFSVIPGSATQAQDREFTNALAHLIQQSIDQGGL